jgi:hypothetical protein
MQLTKQEIKRKTKKAEKDKEQLQLANKTSKWWW